MNRQHTTHSEDMMLDRLSASYDTFREDDAKAVVAMVDRLDKKCDALESVLQDANANLRNLGYFTFTIPK